LTAIRRASAIRAEQLLIYNIAQQGRVYPWFNRLQLASPHVGALESALMLDQQAWALIVAAVLLSAVAIWTVGPALFF
jgi:hypothetical protein